MLPTSGDILQRKGKKHQKYKANKQILSGLRRIIDLYWRVYLVNLLIIHLKPQMDERFFAGFFTYYSYSFGCKPASQAVRRFVRSLTTFHRPSIVATLDSCYLQIFRACECRLYSYYLPSLTLFVRVALDFCLQHAWCLYYCRGFYHFRSKWWMIHLPCNFAHPILYEVCWLDPRLSV
jgi:hypothetical protein